MYEKMAKSKGNNSLGCRMHTPANRVKHRNTCSQEHVRGPLSAHHWRRSSACFLTFYQAFAVILRGWEQNQNVIWRMEPLSRDMALAVATGEFCDVRDENYHAACLLVACPSSALSLGSERGVGKHRLLGTQQFLPAEQPCQLHINTPDCEITIMY